MLAKTLSSEMVSFLPDVQREPGQQVEGIKSCNVFMEGASCENHSLRLIFVFQAQQPAAVGNQNNLSACRTGREPERSVSASGAAAAENEMPECRRRETGGVSWDCKRKILKNACTDKRGRRLNVRKWKT